MGIPIGGRAMPPCGGAKPLPGPVIMCCIEGRGGRCCWVIYPKAACGGVARTAKGSSINGRLNAMGGGAGRAWGGGAMAIGTGARDAVMKLPKASWLGDVATACGGGGVEMKPKALCWCCCDEGGRGGEEDDGVEDGEGVAAITKAPNCSQSLWVVTLPFSWSS